MNQKQYETLQDKLSPDFKTAQDKVENVVTEWNESSPEKRFGLLQEYFLAIEIVSKINFSKKVECFMIGGLNSFSRIRDCRNEPAKNRQICNAYICQTKKLLSDLYINEGLEGKRKFLNNKYRPRFLLLS